MRISFSKQRKSAKKEKQQKEYKEEVIRTIIKNKEAKKSSENNCRAIIIIENAIKTRRCLSNSPFRKILHKGLNLKNYVKIVF